MAEKWEIPSIVNGFGGTSMETHAHPKMRGQLFAGWWFGTFSIFPYIGNNHSNWLSYFSEGFKPPTRFVTCRSYVFLLLQARKRPTLHRKPQTCGDHAHFPGWNPPSLGGTSQTYTKIKCPKPYSEAENVPHEGFHKWGYRQMDGLYRENTIQMHELIELGVLPISGNLHISHVLSAESLHWFILPANDTPTHLQDIKNATLRTTNTSWTIVSYFPTYELMAYITSQLSEGFHQVSSRISLDSFSGWNHHNITKRWDLTALVFFNPTHIMQFTSHIFPLVKPTVHHVRQLSS